MTTIDGNDILERLNDVARRGVERIDAFAEIGSTSTWLMQEAPPAPGRCRIAVADRQTAGRGRRDNRWESPAGAGLWLSLAYTFVEMPRQLQVLTLVVGAGIAATLRRLGAEVWLKWPNDLIAGGAKVGGILAERQSQAERGHTVVVGVGINFDLPQALRDALETERGSAVTGLNACLDRLPPPDEFAALVVTALVAATERVAMNDVAGTLDAWKRYDWLAGKNVTVEQDGRRITGIAKGIDKDGALLLVADGRTLRVLSGSVNLCCAAEACA